MNDVKQFASDKILHHLDVVHRWKMHSNPYAITTEIDPTNVCNHRCPGCAGWLGKKDKSSLNCFELRKIIGQIDDMRGKAVTFTGGGEPLLNKATPAAIDYARWCGLDVALVTNGSNLKSSDYGSLVNNCTWIRISLDAGSAEMHKRTHGTNDFYAIIDNINCLVEAKKRFNKKCTIGLGYLTGLYTDHYEDMMEFVELAIELGVDYAQFRPYHTAAKKDLSKLNEFYNFEPFIRKSNKKTAILYSKHKYDCMKDRKLRPEYGACYGQQFATVITATGDMTICCHTRGIDKFTLGNVKEQKIKDIWHGEKRRRAIDAINLEECPALCRANTFNYILWELAKEKEHVNFL